jgi:glycosyltransferase involved in cell wall biosynthesis
MNVVHVVPAWFGPGGTLGGAERYALELARHMADRIPTRLVTFGPRHRHHRIGSLDVHILGSPWYVRGQRHNPFKCALVRQVLRGDVIHCHQRRIVSSTLSVLLGRLTGRRVFVSDLGGGGWDLSSYIDTDRWYHGHLHVSEYSRRVLGHSDNPRAHVILGGVDVEKFTPAPPALSPREALYVGRLLPHKGIDDLIEAATPELAIHVVGQAYDAPYLRDLYRLADGRPVRFTCNADDGALVRAYQEALCIVLPSVYRSRYGHYSKIPELLGQTLIEGMACGLPAVCTDVASLPEVVEDGVTGFVVPPNSPAALRDRLLWLRRNPERRQQMGEAARKCVLERFTWPAVVQRCLDLYGRPEFIHGGSAHDDAA